MKKNGYNDKFNPDKKELLSVAIKHSGNLTLIAKHFGVSRETVYQYTRRDPDGKKILSEVRGFSSEHFLDLSEHVLQFNLLNYQNNPGLAQRAAEKVLDKKGHLRGWGEVIEDKQSPYQNTIDISHENMMLKDQLEKLKAQLNGNQS